VLALQVTAETFGVVLGDVMLGLPGDGLAAEGTAGGSGLPSGGY
jgi:hypothetical protein